MAAIETDVALDPELPDGWDIDREHAFVGMAVEHTERGAGYRIGAIWIYEGQPERLDLVDDDGGVLNCARDDVEVTR